MILSKTPIISSRLFPLPKSALLQRHNMCGGVFEGVIQINDEIALRVYNAHLGARSQSDRVVQIMSIKEIIRRAPLEGGTWTGYLHDPLWKEDATPPPMPEEFILTGDFNFEAKDPEYDHLAGPMENDLTRLTSKDSYFDTWVITGNDENAGATFSYDPAKFATEGIRIDYAFVDQTLKNQITKTEIDEEAQGSDHQPYWVEFDFHKPN
jgi:endonuclease/exonuclease/phosphatase family metal-dependent hydrolase